MQTKEQARVKYESMLSDVVDLLKQRFDTLWDCGALDHEAFEDNYEQPKILLAANLEHAAFQYKPISTPLRRVGKNLSHF